MNQNTIQIIESSLKGKVSEYFCEDGYVVTENFAAIIDGATAKNNFEIEGDSTGKFIKNTVIEIIKMMKASVTYEECIRFINDSLHQKYQEKGVLEAIEQDRNKTPSASAVIYSKEKHELWFFGDCQALVNNVTITNEKLVDKLTSYMRKWVIEQHLLEGFSEEQIMKNDVGREAIMPFLKNQHVFDGNKSSEFGYSSINGFEFHLTHGKKVKLKEQDTEIVLSSDGYPKLFDNLKETEEYLKECLKEDPLCYKKIISTKGIKEGQLSFDDRCYLKIKVVR